MSYYGKCRAGLKCQRILKLGVELQCLKNGSVTDTRDFALHYIFVDEVHAVMVFQLQQRLCETDNITPTALVIALCPRILRTPANGEAIIAAVKRKPLKISRNFAWEFLLSL